MKPIAKRLLTLTLLVLFAAPVAGQTATPTRTRTPTRTPTSTRTPRPPTPTVTPTRTPTARVYLGQHDTLGSRIRWKDGELWVLRQDGTYGRVVQETPTPTPTP
ncbi:MAG TPA: hypothetical protein VGQ75_10330 [Thermoanaerobaculia bacterium]|jgi:hypothetical protein|nr:hypothetical protein [Thermoanaerobaculia bacterium]HEV8608853.1 hypothetical protein [Thermoanaerobaculia bacterium]